MSAPDSHTVLTLRPDVVVTTLEREAVLLDLETKYFYSVNAPGWAITQLFESGATRAHVCERCRAWGADDPALADVAAFIDRLVAENLVRPDGGGAVAAEAVAFEGTWSVPTLEKHQEPLQRVMISAFDPTLPLAE